MFRYRLDRDKPFHLHATDSLYKTRGTDKLPLRALLALTRPLGWHANAREDMWGACVPCSRQPVPARGNSVCLLEDGQRCPCGTPLGSRAWVETKARWAPSYPEADGSFSKGDLYNGRRRCADGSDNTKGRVRHGPGADVHSESTHVAFTATPGEKCSCVPRSAHTRGTRSHEVCTHG